MNSTFTKIIDYLQNIIDSIDSAYYDGFSWAQPFSFFRLDMLYLIVALSLMLFILRFIKQRRRGKTLQYLLFVVNWMIFIILSTIEIIYIFTFGKDSNWFCMPGRVGWLWAIINFVIFSLVIFNQLLSFNNTLKDIERHSSTILNWKLGFYTLGFGLLASIISFYYFQSILILVLIALILLQLLQLAINIRKIVKTGNIGIAILASVVYLFGSIALILLIINYIFIFILVVLGFLVLWIFSRSGPEKSEPKSMDPLPRCPHCGKTYDSSNQPGCVCEWYQRNRD